MRRHPALAIGIIVGTLILSTAVPAQAAPPRLRLYKGETSQGQRIKYVVAKTDRGRFVSEMDSGVSLTCDDQTNEEFGFGIGFGRSVPITARAFSFDEVFGNIAFHLAGELGSLQGQGTMSVVEADLTDDEQAQLCVSGDLTWEVQFVRVITRTRLDTPAGFVVRAP